MGNIEIDIGRGCVVVITRKQVLDMLKQKQNIPIFEEGLRRGKGILRVRKNGNRQAKTRRNLTISDHY